MLFNLYRASRRYLRGYKSTLLPQNDFFKSLTSTFERTQIAVRIVYVFVFVVSLDVATYSWGQVFNSSFSNPLWPLKILGWPNHSTTIINFTFYAMLVGSAASTLWPHLRAARLVTFLGYFYYLAVINSDGLFANHMHMWLYPLGVLVFLPNINKIGLSRSDRYLYVNVFWFSQFVIAVSYAMAGYFKVTEIVRCVIVEGYSRCELGPYMMTNMAAREYLQFRKPTFVGPLLYDFPWVGFLSYIGVIWFHLATPFFISRLELHRLFLALRIVFHFGTLILFGIGFDSTILAIVAFFGFSPYAAQPIHLFRRQSLSRIPGLKRLSYWQS